MRSRAGKSGSGRYHEGSFSHSPTSPCCRSEASIRRGPIVEMWRTHLAAAVEWAASVVEYAELHWSLVLAAMVVVPVIVALYARSLSSLIETLVLVCLILFAAQRGELVLAVVLCGAAFLAAINGFRRRKADRMRLETKMEIRELARKIDVFLDGLDRRSHQIDLSLAALASSRALGTEGDVPQDGLPVRLPNGMGDGSPEPLARK